MASSQTGPSGSPWPLFYSMGAGGTAGTVATSTIPATAKAAVNQNRP